MLASVGANLLSVIANLIGLYEMVVLVSVLLTWVDPDPYNQVVRFIRQVTEPALRPFRRAMMPLTRQIGIDLSPIALFLLLGIVQGMIQQLAWSLRSGAF